MSSSLGRRIASFGAVVIAVVLVAPKAHAATFVGSAGDDKMFGTNQSDLFRNAAGNDLSFSKGLADQLIGDEGDDVFLLGGGADMVTGGLGSDVALDDDGTPGDVLSGDAGEDTFFSADGAADTISCGAGDNEVAIADAIDSVSGCETVITSTLLVPPYVTIQLGTNVTDVLLGTAQVNLLFGAGGNDVITGGPDVNLLFGGKGQDIVTGGPRSDVMWDDDGEPGDRYSAGEGDDVLFAADGAIDTIDCGTGRDAAFADANDNVKNCEAVLTK